MFTITEAINYAKQAIKEGHAIKFHADFDNNTVDVLSDQGWSQWFPMPESDDSQYWDTYPG